MQFITPPLSTTLKDKKTNGSNKDLPKKKELKNHDNVKISPYNPKSIKWRSNFTLFFSTGFRASYLMYEWWRSDGEREGGIQSWNAKAICPKHQREKEKRKNQKVIIILLFFQILGSKLLVENPIL